jgi:hypothetical protein
MTQAPPHPEGPGEFYRDPADTEWRELTASPSAPQPDPTEDTTDGLPRPAATDQGRGHKRHA